MNEYKLTHKYEQGESPRKRFQKTNYSIFHCTLYSPQLSGLRIGPTRYSIGTEWVFLSVILGIKPYRGENVDSPSLLQFKAEVVPHILY